MPNVDNSRYYNHRPSICQAHFYHFDHFAAVPPAGGHFTIFFRIGFAKLTRFVI